MKNRQANKRRAIQISHWAICALMLVAAPNITAAQDAVPKAKVEGSGIPEGSVFRPGQDPSDFVIGSPPPPPAIPGPKLAGLPDPYREDDNWATMPPGRTWGGASGVSIDRDGKSVWFITRCDTPSTGCADPKNNNIDPVFEFNANGKVMRNWGHGLFKFPHGIFVDRKTGNVWVADGKAGNKPGRVGNTVREFTPDGKLLMTLGKEGVLSDGTDPYLFREPVTMSVAANGDIYVVDGHDGKGNNRIVRYDRTGKFITQWGSQGTSDTEFNPAHGVAFDKAGNVYVADRGNDAVKVFTQDGKLLHVYQNFGIPNGIFIDKNDIIYVADSNMPEPKPAPGFGVAGIRIASVKDPGKLIADIPFGEDFTLEAVTVGDDGTVYGGFTHKPGAHRWFRTGPLVGK